MTVRVIRNWLRDADPFRKNRPQGGFTLIEIIAAVVALSFVLYMSVGLLSRSGRIYEFILQRQSIAKASRQAQERIFQEVKLSDSLMVADRQELKVLPGSGKNCSYVITADRITRSEDGGTPQILVTHVKSAASFFRYYDANDLELSSVPLSETDLQAVRFIEVNLAFLNRDQSLTSRRLIYLENFRFK